MKVPRLALLAGLFAAGATVFAADDIPGPVAKKTYDADLAFLEKGLGKAPPNNAVGTLKAVAMFVALNAQNGLGGKDDAAAAGARDKAVEAALVIGKKVGKDGFNKRPDDVAKALELVKGIASAKSDKKEKVDLIKEGKFKLNEVMSVYRPAGSNGLNIQKDIEKYLKKYDPATDADAAAVLASRNILVALYSKDMGDQANADDDKKKKQWAILNDDALKISKEILNEAAKGSKGNKAATEKQFVALLANCNACHTAFRDN